MVAAPADLQQVGYKDKDQHEDGNILYRFPDQIYHFVASTAVFGSNVLLPAQNVSVSFILYSTVMKRLLS